MGDSVGSVYIFGVLLFYYYLFFSFFFPQKEEIALESFLAHLVQKYLHVLSK